MTPAGAQLSSAILPQPSLAQPATGYVTAPLTPGFLLQALQAQEAMTDDSYIDNSTAFSTLTQLPTRELPYMSSHVKPSQDKVQPLPAESDYGQPMWQSLPLHAFLHMKSFGGGNASIFGQKSKWSLEKTIRCWLHKRVTQPIQNVTTLLTNEIASF